MLFRVVNDTNVRNAFQYIEGLLVDEKYLSQKKIVTILTAAILRYLEGLTTIKFVFDLTEAISHNRNDYLDDSIEDVLSLLNHLKSWAMSESLNEKEMDDALLNILDKLTQLPGSH